MKKEEILVLNQLIKSMMEAAKILEKAYNDKKADEFNKAKKTMLALQKEIANMIK
jgi:hypothetical protein